MKTHLRLAALAGLLCAAFTLTACSPSFRSGGHLSDNGKPFMVKVILVHKTTGGWNDSVSDYTTFERADTHERFVRESACWGQPGDTFALTP